MPLQNECELFVSYLLGCKTERFWTHASTTLPVSIWKCVGAFWLSQWLGGVLVPFAGVEEGKKMSSMKRVVSSKVPIGPLLRNTFSPSGDLEMVTCNSYSEGLTTWIKYVKQVKVRFKELLEKEGVEVSVFLDILSVRSPYPKQKWGSAGLKWDMEMGEFVFHAPQHFFKIFLQTFTDPVLLPCFWGLGCSW